MRTLLAINEKSSEQSFWKNMDSFVLLVYARLTASRAFLQQLLACLNFRIRRFILFLQTKKVIYMNYCSSRSSWKPWWWVRLDLIFPMRYIYINSNLNTEFTKSSRSTKFKLVLPRNVSQIITKNVSISTRIVISYAIKRDIPLRIWWKVIGNWYKTWSQVPDEWKVIVKQEVSEETKKKKTQKSRTMIITVWDLFLFYFCNYFCLKNLRLRCCIGLELNILTWSTKVLKGIEY